MTSVNFEAVIRTKEFVVSCNDGQSDNVVNCLNVVFIFASLFSSLGLWLAKNRL